MGIRGIAQPFHDHSTRRVWGVSVTPRPLFTPGKDPVFNLQEAGWAPEPVWTVAENLAPTGIWSPDRPVRSQSLYRLSYSAHPHRLKGERNVEFPSWIWHSAQIGRQSCQLCAPAALYPQGNCLVLVSVKGWVDYSAIECGQKEKVTWKFPRTLPGIEPITSRLVA